jgi:hypothetical protein
LWKGPKKDHEILAALQYKPLYNISCSEKWGKKIQAASYNSVRTVNKNVIKTVEISRETNSKGKCGNDKYATIGLVTWFLMISADPGIFGVYCNVWPDPAFSFTNPIDAYLPLLKNTLNLISNWFDEKIIM